ncbi:MAG TPA: YdeI/OmpD-associated family protein [Thermoanaerobaculia bacterium]|nr:YdeI/OmpD-associated family protein [Thermoanaerobaculia bacterium]
MAAKDVTFFPTAPDFRRWLEANHDRVQELVVGFYKKDSGKPSITYSEALDEALCFGWIDGVRKKYGDDGYTIRFTPRKPKSIWSLVNIRKVEDLIQRGRMKPSGLKAFEARDAERTGVYSFERETAELGPALEKVFRANKKAWEFFEKQPPGYRRLAAWFVISAKKQETREKRLGQLIEDSAAGKRIGILARPAKGQES